MKANDYNNSKALPFLEGVFLYLAMVCIFFIYPPITQYLSLKSVDYGKYFLTELDKIIPYSPYFLFAYFIFYPVLLLLPILIFLKTDEERITTIRKICGGSAALYFVTYLFFLIFPNSTHSLVDVFKQFTCTPTDHLTYWFNSKIMSFYGANPSLHIAESYLLIRVWFELTPKSSFNRYFSLFLVCWFITLIIAVLTLKYHYLLDVIFGCLLAQIIYSLIITHDVLQTAKWSFFMGVKKRLFLLALFIVSTITLITYLSNHLGVILFMC